MLLHTPPYLPLHPLDRSRRHGQIVSTVFILVSRRGATAVHQFSSQRRLPFTSTWPAPSKEDLRRPTDMQSGLWYRRQQPHMSQPRRRLHDARASSCTATTATPITNSTSTPCRRMTYQSTRTICPYFSVNIRRSSSRAGTMSTYHIPPNLDTPITNPYCTSRLQTLSTNSGRSWHPRAPLRT